MVLELVSMTKVCILIFTVCPTWLEFWKLIKISKLIHLWEYKEKTSNEITYVGAFLQETVWLTITLGYIVEYLKSYDALTSPKE